ncbi:dihydrolipoyl dehydrogenase family protein [Nitratidesulfovibrio sp. SRB-5]|uniref:dihydrolipoyl dehydrogenase family protein n=1 Tax=Nitratidesulfovibrio sp. SRB-5 TaxID=2872636 RepID=UPI00102565DC|nr:NAD(P)/FAD-dependent oxidoreductase [Nitratidesulfovibrio sp. SRB-5]MBZ2171609.1 NAD(P)/FAD-dependent oxidoreductase [Nitratidesulfovibrio sp. SRB-5]RXF78082.1 NAD(P)/FAD-dependent oxidoreductase [Desulfovibrio sp. DS-1]
MTPSTRYDMIILGGGPGGSRAAFDAAARGLSVALVDRDGLGGTCLNRGCIPTKLLLGATAALPLLETQKKLKGADGHIAFDLPALQQRKDRYVKGTRQALEKRLKAAGIAVYAGEGRVTGERQGDADGELAVVATQADGTTQETRLGWGTLIVATGSTPASFPGLAADGAAVLDSTALLDVTKAPESLIVVGGGAIGLEMADFFSRLGTRITIVEGMGRLAPTEDPEVGDTLRKVYAREGWTIHTGRKVASLATVDGHAVLRFEDGEELTASKALLAVGRRPASVGIGLEALGATLRGPGWVQTDAWLRAAPHVYAIGDVNGRTLLAHAADHQARHAVRHACGDTAAPYDAGVMPACIYGHLEAMRVGPTAEELKNAGFSPRVSRSMLIANPIAQAYGMTQGFIKIVWVDGRIRGVTAVGHGVSHLVTLAAVLAGGSGTATGWTAHDAGNVIFAHPTLDEALEAAIEAPQEPA